MTSPDLITDLAIPGLVWLLMLVVGLDLAPADFRRVLRYPRAVTVATLGQLALLPASAALLVWAQRPDPVEKARQILQVLSLIALGCLVALILFDQRQGLLDAIGAAFPVVLPFCLLTMAAGFGLGWVARLEYRDRVTLLIEFSTRNLGLVAVMGVAILGDVRLVLFATLFFLVELPIVIALIGLRARQSASR